MKMTLVKVDGRLFKKWAIQLEGGKYLDNSNDGNMTPWNPMFRTVCYWTFWSKKQALKNARKHRGNINKRLGPTVEKVREL
jgi:hypothetical protein